MREFSYPPTPVKTVKTSSDPYDELLKKIEQEYLVIDETDVIVFPDMSIDGISKRVTKCQSIITHFNNQIHQSLKYNHRSATIKENIDLWLKLSNYTLAKKAINFPIIFTRYQSNNIVYENSVECVSLASVIHGMLGPKDLEREVLDFQVTMIYVQLAAQGYTLDGRPNLGLIRIPKSTVTYVDGSLSVTVDITYIVLLLPTSKLKPASQIDAFISYLQYLSSTMPYENNNIYSSFVEYIICKFYKLFIVDKKSVKPQPLRNIPYGCVPVNDYTEVATNVYVVSGGDRINEGILLRNEPSSNNVYVLFKMDNNQYYKNYIEKSNVYWLPSPVIKFGLGIDVLEKFR
jgi:hypothetical protein